MNYPGTDEKVQESTQDPVKVVSKQIATSESNQMKTEVKEEVKTERFEDFEVHEQFGIDYITSKNLNDPFIKSETSRMKTEFNSEVKEETFQEFEAHEQVGIDHITNKDFDHPFIDTFSKGSDISSLNEDIKFRMKTEFKAKLKMRNFILTSRLG